MSGPDSSPNFDWLNKEPEKKLPPSKEKGPLSFLDMTGALFVPPVIPPAEMEEAPEDDIIRGDNETPAVPHQETTAEPLVEILDQSDTSAIPAAEEHSSLPAKEPAAHASSLLDDLESVPDPILNHSDGTAIILRNRQDREDAFPAEEFSMPAPPPESSVFSGEGVPSETENPLEVEKHLEVQDQDSPEASEPEELPTSDETATFNVSDLIPSDEEHAASSEMGDTSETADRELFPAGMANFEELESDPEGSYQQSDQALASEETLPAGEDTNGSAIVDEAALPAPPGNGDQGRTEVLHAEDLAKARQSVGSIPTLEDTGWAATEGFGGFSGAIPGTAASPLSTERPVTGSVITAGATVSPGPSRMFVILASYASAITIAFLALLMKQIYDNGHPHQLESLPDIATQKESELTYIPPYSGLPPGHTLRLGEKRRFGNIEVEPLAITQEPVEFVHYTGDTQRHREPTQPVWKLKVRFTNVSQDQDIAPLDRQLVLRWVSKSGNRMDYSNYFITEAGTHDKNAPAVQLYRLPPQSDWDLVGQDLGKTLKPGESYETFLASAEEVPGSLPEDLVWRVQIRKGYSNKGNGVTTIFQVAFKKDDVTSGTETTGADQHEAGSGESLRLSPGLAEGVLGLIVVLELTSHFRKEISHG